MLRKTRGSSGEKYNWGFNSDEFREKGMGWGTFWVVRDDPPMPHWPPPQIVEQVGIGLVRESKYETHVDPFFCWIMGEVQGCCQ